MIPRNDVISFINTYLSVKEFEDYSPNGLQVEGKEHINKIIGGVTACLELFERAAEEKADLVLVHHGLIWFGVQPSFTGSYGRRLKILFDNDLNLAAYHLPLDGHLEVGNAAVLARKLDLNDIQPYFNHKNSTIGVTGSCTDRGIDGIISEWKKFSSREPLVFPYGKARINKVAIATGAAQKEIYQAIAAGADLFITGEVSEQTMHIAKEERINFISAGHHETEKFGVAALGEKLKEKFDIDFRFIDITNPA
jgi:dinuclear metal center YbgI/SA1388 family protein